ncbi:DUF5999 family protein [Streptomyces sp. NPDC051555]|uniref:DUF5999 family protein n=1 Tax=Streptomyces sp. NPDC051555 TaxID=3365657 RepID=UPI0037A7E911
MECKHKPAYPAAEADGHVAARLMTSRVEQGWLLCDDVVVFEDGGELRPDGRCTGARRPIVTVTS